MRNVHWTNTFRDWRKKGMKCFGCNIVPFVLQTTLKEGNIMGVFVFAFCTWKLTIIHSITDMSELQASDHILDPKFIFYFYFESFKNSLFLHNYVIVWGIPVFLPWCFYPFPKPRWSPGLLHFTCLRIMDKINKCETRPLTKLCGVIQTAV